MSNLSFSSTSPLSPPWVSTVYLLGFFACVGLMAAAYYFEYVEFLDPCPLCMVQRLATVLIGLGFLACFFTRQSRWVIGALIFTLAASIFGFVVADHHVWLQNLPPSEVPECVPSLEYLIETMPLSEVLSIMLGGTGNCAEIDWQFLGLSMPEWTRVWYAGFTALSALLLVRIVRIIA